MEPAMCSGLPLIQRDERALPDRRVGKQRKFYAVYGSTHPTEFLLVTLQNARPWGRSGIARRASRLFPGRRRSVQRGFIPPWNRRVTEFSTDP